MENYILQTPCGKDKGVNQNHHFEETSEVQLAIGSFSVGVHTKALCCKCLKLCSMLTCTISASIFFAFPDWSSPSIWDMMLHTMFSSVSGWSSDLGYGDSLSSCKSICALDWDLGVPWTVSSRSPGITPSLRIGSLYLHRSLWHIVSNAPTACSRLWREPFSSTSTTASTPPSSDVKAILPSSKPTKDSMRALHFSAVFEDFLQFLSKLTIDGIGSVSRMTWRLFGCVERLERAITASALACGLPCLRTCTRRGMAPEAVIIGLLTVEADRVSREAVAYSCRFKSCDLRKQIMGSKAPASTMLILFLQRKKQLLNFLWTLSKLILSTKSARRVKTIILFVSSKQPS